MSKEKYRARVHMILLYPDNESHRDALDKITKSYDYAGIIHDAVQEATAEANEQNAKHKKPSHTYALSTPETTRRSLPL